MKLIPTRLRTPLFATAITLAIQQAPVHAAPKDAQAKPQGQKSIVSGVLSAPSSLAPQLAAREFLRGYLDAPNVENLEWLGNTKIAAGNLVRYRQLYKGVPIIGHETIVRLDALGQARWAAMGSGLGLDAFDVAPSLSTDEAVAIAGVGARGRLVIHASHPSNARLAYQMSLPYNPLTRRSDRVYLDAHTGEIYQRENLVRYAAPRAEVFPQNPVTTPDLAVKELTRLEGRTSLDDGEISVASCVDRNVCQEGLGHACVPEVLATPNGAGDYTDHVYKSDVDPEDGFSEVSAYYHVRRAYDTARSLGFTTLQAPLQVMVNATDPAYDPIDCEGDNYRGTGKLTVLENAFFEPEMGLVFGQGEAVDYAYDGDVVYHEFGHAVMFDFNPDLGVGGLDAQGYDASPGALHEGYADILTMIVTGESNSGEYVGLNRDANNDATCPNDTMGEMHEDGKILTGALWEAREAVATTDEARQKFDEAIFSAFLALDASATFTTAATLTTAEVKTRLGDEAESEVSEIFKRRGFDGCERVVDGSVKSGYLMIEGTGAIGGEEVPAPVQQRFVVPAGSSSLTVSARFADEVPEEFRAKTQLVVRLKAGDEPIAWADKSGSFASDGEIALPLTITDGGLQGVVTGLDEGSYHLIVVNTAEFPMLITELVVSAGDAEESTGGCGCRAGSDSNSGGSMLLLIMSALWMRRRKAAGPQ